MIDPDILNALHHLDPVSYALLAATNPFRLSNEDKKDTPFVFTTKEFYLLSAAMSQADGPYYYDERTFNVPESDIDRLLLRIKRLHENRRSPVSHRGPAEGAIDSAIARVLFGGNNNLASNLRAYTEDRITSLEQNGYIVDPFTEGLLGLPFMVVGIVPVSFTKRTEKGEVIYRRISAILWEFEYLKDEDREVLEFHFRAEKAIRLLKERIRVTWRS